MNTKDFDPTVKRVKAFALEVRELDDAGSFEGYASVFGVKDSYGEVVAAGAFKQSLKAFKASKTMPALLWQHNAREPIGTHTEIKEDDHGLFIRGQLVLEVQRAREAHALLKAKAINGISIGFMPKKWKFDEESKLLTLTEVDLWENSLVTFPANPEARVSQVRASNIDSVRALEAFLRDEGGFSREQAKAIASRGWAGLEGRRDDGDEAAALKEIAELIARTTRNLQS
jgi:HK97 family phage prohead protease